MIKPERRLIVQPRAFGKATTLDRIFLNCCRALQIGQRVALYLQTGAWVVTKIHENRFRLIHRKAVHD